MSIPRTELALTTNVARALIEAGCVQFRVDEPFRLPSGWTSPVYMDCRRLISFPRLRHDLVNASVHLLHERDCLGDVDAIVGAESSGIALAAWIADKLQLPLQYARKKAKGLGPSTQIEGVVEAGDRVLLVDDLMAAGESKREFCRALNEVGAKMKDIFVIFDYGVFPTAEVLERWGVTVHSLATWQDVLISARSERLVDERSLNELEAYLKNPVAWSHAHGGIVWTRR
ncbi:orotate phosphoribosyltransferase [Paraburkholderia xenovorans]|uniref:orotate phosphoribosyltransferase n=1 Tax=Paraburkholderia xenovorans TaxID=36873 RepID=UPI0015593428|nr:orotate phosphoribosyltransferase [Paraburkholderia xenovorans]NPT34948.1 orotate phosphoribosyltransferase [Paraburkholderia xenovorans]